MMVRILYVEDNPADFEMLADGFAERGSRVSIARAETGTQALEVLFRRGAHAGASRPDLVLLDLNLPELDGRSVLAALAADPATRSLPVVVLTTSAAAVDVDACYELGASAFITKPLDLAGLRKVVGAIDDFWVSTNVFPAAR